MERFARMRGKGWLCALAGWWLAIGPVTWTGGAEPADPVGKEVKDFALQDFRGKRHQLSDFRESRLVVVAFLGTECPLAKLYGPRLQKLVGAYQPAEVSLIGVISNRQDSITEMAAYARLHGLEFPLLKDVGNQVADAMGAVRTPEVFLLDSERKVRYWGRVDDQYGIGFVREEPQRDDLKIAIQECLAGKAVSQPRQPAEGCFIGRVMQADTTSPVTYANQVSRILQARCVECHREGEIAPFALLDYDAVAGWAETIAEVVRDQRMPPWHASPKFGHFSNDRRMSDKEKELIYRWVDAGAPEGDPADLPKPRDYTPGWQLSRAPDAVVPLSRQPYRVPATGVVRYQYFKVDPGFKEDKWIQAAEILPGNRAVVHHVLAFAVQRGSRGLNGADGFLVGYVPGLRNEPYPPGMAKRIPAGSQLVFQVHYTPIGSVQMDQSKIGFVFADPDTVTREVRTTSAMQRVLRIPPETESHRVTAVSRSMPRDLLLLGFMPHMHLRGKAFRYELEPRGGNVETLIDIPKYDFNWQTSYRLKEPLTLKAGSRIRCTALFDNSKYNLNNPDPSQTVRWGDQTWEEMMIGYFDVAVPRRRTRDEAQDANRDLFDRMDADGNGSIQKDEVSGRMRILFTFWDVDRDGNLTRKEVEAGRDRLRREE